MARIAVIGAGMGGLAVAARLAIAGHQVVVHERSMVCGGSVGRLERDGFAFDTGPGLLLLPAVYRDLFIKTGKAALEDRVGLVQVDPAGRHVFADGTDVVLPNASRSGVMAALDGAFGAGSGQRWADAMVRARTAWEITRRPLLEEVLGDPAAHVRDPYPAVARRGLFRRPGATTLAGVAARELGGGGPGAILESWAVTYGLDPRVAPASAAVLPYVEQTFGVWAVRGGLRALVDALAERCAERRVEVRYGSRVTGLVVDGDRVAGVELDGGVRESADAVVAAAPLPALYADGVLPDRALPGGVGGPAGEPGRVTVHLALRGGRPADAVHRMVVHAAARDAALDWAFATAGGTAADPGRGALGVTVLRPDDPAAVPDDGYEAVTLVATVPPQGVVDWAAPQAGAACAERMVEAASAALPRLREREMWRQVRTPLDTARDTGAPGGSVPAPVLAGAGGALLRPSNRTALTGLYHAGGWAHPGGGLAHAGMSAAITADLIAGGPGGSR